MAARISIDGVPVDEYRAQQFTEREQRLLEAEQRAQEAQTVAHVALAQAQAIATAAYCEAFLLVMEAGDKVTWSREEMLTLLGQALRGR